MAKTFMVGNKRVTTNRFGALDLRLGMGCGHEEGLLPASVTSS